MSRYIDADALRHMVLYFADARNLNGNHEQAKAYNHCLCMIDDEPTADVVEVVHGEWVDKGEDYMIRWTCSNCGRRDTHIYDFCPDCGADMRGGTE